MQRFTLPRLGRHWPTGEEQPAVRLESIEYALSSAELPPFAAALRARLGSGPARSFSSPAEIQAGLLAFLGPAVEGGSVEVSRSPGALYTLEYWHVRLLNVTADGRDAMDELMNGARGVR